MRPFLFAVVFALCAANACAFSQGVTKDGEHSLPTMPPNSSASSSRGTEELPFVVRTVPTPKTEQEITAEAKAYKEKISNEKWLVIFSALLVFVTACLVVFTAKLWGATVKLVKSAEDTAQRQLRAYVCVTAGTMSFGRRESPEAEVIFKNCGQTPAYDVRQWIQMWIAEYPLRESLPTPPPEFRMASSILPPGGHTIMFMLKEPPVPPEAVDLLGTPKGTIYVYGEVRYRDIFNVERFTKYRLMYGGAEGTRDGKMKPCDEGNDGN